MNSPLISFDQYKKSISGQNLYNGHFWTMGGDLFKVETERIMTRSPRPSSPYEKHPGYLNTDTFRVIEKKRIKITLEELGDKNIVYDENGDFVDTIDCHNPQRKGEIFIRKMNRKFKLPNPTGLVYKDMEVAKDYDDLPFRSSEAKTNLTAEAYSKIFTHILSMDDKIEKDLKGLRKGKVSVEMEIGGARSYYNMAENERHPLENANAYASARDNIVVAKIGAGVVNADDTYATVWNILSLLGVHEMKHVTLPWTGNIHRTHHLNYMFQKGHHTWENTTPSFKANIDETLKTKYYKEYKEEIPKDYFRETYERYKKFGIFPREKEQFEDIENRIINILNNKDRLNAMDEYFEGVDRHRGHGYEYEYRKKK